MAHKYLTFDIETAKPWADGKRQEVLDYVVQDVRTTFA